jgi:hypothetical protein
MKNKKVLVTIYVLKPDSGFYRQCMFVYKPNHMSTHFEDWVAQLYPRRPPNQDRHLTFRYSTPEFSKLNYS